MMNHHSVMKSSLHIKNLKNDKFEDFLSDIDYSSKYVNSEGCLCLTKKMKVKVSYLRLLYNKHRIT